MEDVKKEFLDLRPIEDFLDKEIERWKTLHPGQGGVAILTGKVPLSEVVKFLIASTDEFVVLVGSMLGSKGDVKAIVLDLLGRLYDVITVGLLPIWLKPFAGTVRYLIIDVVLSNLIDYLMKQYSSGARVAMLSHEGEAVSILQWRAHN